MARKLAVNGVIPANLTPFTADLAIDEPGLRLHLEQLASTSGVVGITCNGHAAEVSSLSRDERKRCLTIAVDQARGRVSVVAGIYADSTSEAIGLSRDAAAAGADGLLIFPSNLFILGAQRRPEMVYRHFAAIADSTDLPIIVFQYPPHLGFGYSTATLVQLASIPNVVAVKEWGLDIVAFERNVRALRALDRRIAVLTSFSQSLLATLALGADGILSGHGSMVAHLQVELFDAVRDGRLAAAQRITDRLFPLTEVVYAEPFLDMYTRMKEALVLLGRWERAAVRPPLLPLPDHEREHIRAALQAAQLLPRPGRECAA